MRSIRQKYSCLNAAPWRLHLITRVPRELPLKGKPFVSCAARIFPFLRIYDVKLEISLPLEGKVANVRAG